MVTKQSFDFKFPNVHSSLSPTFREVKVTELNTWI